jgi:hypothetical protein
MSYSGTSRRRVAQWVLTRVYSASSILSYYRAHGGITAVSIAHNGTNNLSGLETRRFQDFWLLKLSPPWWISDAYSAH